MRGCTKSLTTPIGCMFGIVWIKKPNPTSLACERAGVVLVVAFVVTANYLLGKIAIVLAQLMIIDDFSV